MTKIFIDGSAGTTGLQIHDRLSKRKDIQLLTISDEKRKDNAARKELFAEADIVFLCLPDAAAIEAVSLAHKDTVLIDTSTAHRVSEAWTYGFPELTGRREKIKTSRRIANPGCHAIGFIALIAPLVENKILSPESRLTCFSLTGYSGGGKQMIAEYEAPAREALLEAPRQYALSQSHKHLPEMMKECGLKSAPLFSPIVAPYYSGMEVTVPLHRDSLNSGIESIKEVYHSYYQDGVVHFRENSGESGFLSAGAFSGRDDMELAVWGNEERILLTARFDNLGKGASGAAVQNMNLVMGTSEFEGLNL